MTKKLLLVILLVIITTDCFSQTDVVDTLRNDEHVPDSNIYNPYNDYSNGVYVWDRIIWRSLNTDSLENSIYFKPSFSIEGKFVTEFSLWEIIKEKIVNNEITVYHSFNPLKLDMHDDQFRYPVYISEGKTFDPDSAYTEYLVLYTMLGRKEDGPRSGKKYH